MNSHEFRKAGLRAGSAFFSYQMQLFGRPFHSCPDAGARCGSTAERWSSLFPVGVRDLAKLAHRGLVWADCEALERGHNPRRGTLVLLDMVPEAGTPSYAERRAMLDTIIPTDAVFSGDTSRLVPCGAVVLTPKMRVDSHDNALSFYQRLCDANLGLGCDFFEGLVVKRADSPYPVQMRSATEEFRVWVKHRFLV